MRKTMPVREYMSRLPEEIDRHDTLAAAVKHMHQRSIRRVSVMDGAQVYGILSRRDALDASLRLGACAWTVAVGDVCERGTLSVSPTTPIPEVAQQMVRTGGDQRARHRRGGAGRRLHQRRCAAAARRYFEGSAFATDSRN